MDRKSSALLVYLILAVLLCPTTVKMFSALMVYLSLDALTSF